MQIEKHEDSLNLSWTFHPPNLANETTSSPELHQSIAIAPPKTQHLQIESISRLNIC
ncbi:MAG: hypothetical protein VKL59_27235 [Nostocaceae cyanobacterium]|nr:hypothetical protein [Nostocaceae cyanobacterium]